MYFATGVDEMLRLGQQCRGFAIYQPRNPMHSPLKQTRLRRGGTLAAVSAAVGTNTGNLSRIENGKQKASPKLAAKLALYFGHEITEIQILYPERYAQ
jgi:transcriptional regulator with XRE-family HTH domain